jgi:hypothetical protein
MERIGIVVATKARKDLPHREAPDVGEIIPFPEKRR